MKISFPYIYKYYMSRGGEKRSFNYLTYVSGTTVKRLSIDGLSTEVNYKKYNFQFSRV